MEKKIIKITIDGVDQTKFISDGYHTFDELYAHRITLFIALCRAYIGATGQPIEIRNGNIVAGKDSKVWRSKRHSDGELCFGTGLEFVMGIGRKKGQQITYHLPIEFWSVTEFAETLDKAPEWDGHTSDDVLYRLILL